MTDELRNATVEIGNPGLNGGGVAASELTAAVADRAPNSATFITQTANASLTAEQALSALATGLLKVTTGTGVLSIAVGADVPAHTHTGITTSLNREIDGGGAVITTGIKRGPRLDFAGTIIKAQLYADQATNTVVDIWKDAFAGFPPDDANSITAAAPLTLTGGFQLSTTVLTGWNTTINAGDFLWFNVDSNTAATWLLVVLTITRSI